MIDALTFVFLLSLIALTAVLWNWREVPAMRLWGGLQALRSLFWFTHAWPIITAITLIFPVFQLLVVAETIWRSGILLPDGRRGGYYWWCGLVGAGAALLAVAQSPEPYPILSPFAFELKLALHLLGLMALLASLAYTKLIMRSRDALGTRIRWAMALYLTSSVASNRVHDPALYEAYTIGGTLLHTAAVILLIAAFLSARSARASYAGSHLGGPGRVGGALSH